jgi:hypothetical protein
LPDKEEQNKMNGNKSQTHLLVSNEYHYQTFVTIISNAGPSTMSADPSTILGAGRPSGQQFVDDFREGVRAMLRRRGYSDPSGVEKVLATAYARTETCVSLNLQEIGKILRDEIIRIAPDILASPSRHPGSPARMASLRRALAGLSDRELAAVRAYYVDLLDESWICSQFGISLQAFAATRASLRTRGRSA